MPADVARRHARDTAVVLRDVVKKSTRVEYACDGSISAFWLRMALEPTLGYVRKLRFLPPIERPSATVAWEAVTGSGQAVTGTVTVRTAVTADEIVSWVDVTFDG